MYTEYNYDNYLYHSGIKGMKWGIRRYQNEDGSLTPAGKERYGSKKNYEAYKAERKERNKKILKTAGKVAAGAAAAYVGYNLLSGTIKGASDYYKENKSQVDAVIAFKYKQPVSELPSKIKTAGKNYIKTTANSVKEGVKEGIKEAPKKAAKAVVIGATMNVAKKGLDYTVGENESTKIFQANDPKKIGKFWRVNNND